MSSEKILRHSGTHSSIGDSALELDSRSIGGNGLHPHRQWNPLRQFRVLVSLH